MSISEKTKRTLSGEWKLKGPFPTVEEIISMANELRESAIPRDAFVKYDPAYSDITTFPARFYVEPLEVED